MPIWIADFVIGSYGHGAVFADAHDERDFAFAKKFGIPLKPTLRPLDGRDDSAIRNLEECFTGDGILHDSGAFNGLTSAEARAKIPQWLEKLGKGRAVTTYRLRDWLISRQRYWGAPIPIVYDPEGNPHHIPEEHLPWLLPADVEFKPTGESPLAHSRGFLERPERIFGKGWRPECDTMDTFVCSSFYYLMYLSTPGHGLKSQILNSKFQIPDSTLIDPEIEKRWMPVSMYIGGPEHACMHLIYARFVMMALKDFGIVSHEEPFQRLVHQGLITYRGAKMSKSKGNVVSPDPFIEKYGSDVFRMYLMFMGPFTDGGDWSDTGIKGIDRFVQRIWRVFTTVQTGEEDPAVTAARHATTKKVTEDMEKMHFNTAISALMEFLNLLEGRSCVSRETAEAFVKLLAPLAPHLAEELWEKLGATGDKKSFVIEQDWPAYDPAFLQRETLTIVVQINGKVRAQVQVPSRATEQEVLALAKAHDNVRKHLEGKEIRKEVYIPGKLVSLVA